jgi:putative pantetheine hydrolase
MPSVRHGDLTDVRGVRIGHHQRDGRGWLTGVTVVLPPEATVGAVDVRGGAPGTRETDALDPRNVVPHVHGIVLSGGSAYGLATADGVVRWLAEHRRGLRVGPRADMVVPVVPGAVLFDLGRGGHFERRPDAGFGYAAAGAATTRHSARGCVGAGTGARAGGLKGGIGGASVVLESGITVAALVVLNCAGLTLDRSDGRLLGAAWLDAAGARLPTAVEHAALLAHLASVQPPPLNTTLAVIATDADLGKAEAQKMAGVAHDGLARAIRPLHSQADGDVVFALATGRTALPAIGGPRARWGVARTGAFNAVLTAAADVATRAVVDAVLAATGRPGLPAYRDLCPSVVEGLASAP